MLYTHLMRRSFVGLAAVALAASTARAAEPAADTKAGGPKEQEQLQILRAGEPAAKALACKQLAIHGTAAAVPTLAPLLADPHLASWARIALEVIPGNEADTALVDAAGKLDGLLLVGTLNSLGVRRTAAAVDVLAKHLKNQDAQVASAAAVALGRVGNPAATKTLREALAAAPEPVRPAVAEGCILCAERLMTDGQGKEAAEVYDEVRKADVPKPRVLEATRGAILARGTGGIPLLLEQLKSDDKALVYIALAAARELPGHEVPEALSGELAKTHPDRQALLLYALGDRNDATLSPAVLAAAKNGPPPVRIAAVSLIGRIGDASSLPTLLELAAADDAQVSQAAKTALLEGLSGDKVNAAIVERLGQAEGKTLVVMLEMIGGRRIHATPALVKAAGQQNPAIRGAALAALGETVRPEEVGVLVAEVLAPRSAEDAKIAAGALKTACVRMPDRERVAAELAAAMPRASLAAKKSLLETLGAMEGRQALETVAAAVRSDNDELQDTGSRLLGEWLSIDAAPVLLDLAKTASGDKYQVRALRGYLRMARQFANSPAQRAEMCQNALAAAGRDDERELAFSVLSKFPCIEGLRVVANAAQTPALKKDALVAAATIGRSPVGKTSEGRELLGKVGIEPTTVEILKAEYGAGSNRLDVTETLRKLAQDSPTIVLPRATYNGAFGADPVPGAAKDLKVKYRINGKEADVTFAENAPIELPTPK